MTTFDRSSLSCLAGIIKCFSGWSGGDGSVDYNHKSAPRSKCLADFSRDGVRHSFGGFHRSIRNEHRVYTTRFQQINPDSPLF
jgi:hypothetical protein